MDRIYRTDAGQAEIRAWCDARLEAWGTTHETRVVATALGDTHIVSAGEGPPLVLVPGTNMAAATWLHVIEALASSHRVHAVDLPGQPGLSDPRRQRHVGDDLGRWLIDVFTAVGAADPIVVGHSLGGLVAMHAAAAGAAVGRLVLVDPAGLRRLSVTPKVLVATLPWLRRSDARSAAGLLRMMMAPGSHPAYDLIAWMALVGRHVRSSLAPPRLHDEALHRLTGIRVDVVVGAHDVFLPPEKLRQATTRRLPGASFAVVPGTGHLAPYEHPGSLVDLLRPPTPDAAGGVE